MDIFLDLLANFILVLGYGITFQAPRNSLPLLGLTGTLSWAGLLVVQKIANNLILASFIAAIIVGICGEVFARIKKLPATVFVISGVLPLVPGVPAYHTMLYLIKDDYLSALETGLKTILIGGAISFAIAIVGAGAKYYKELRGNKRS
ncbi:threonine/serine exporter family protein [Halanaerocella petrolearia]